MAPLGPETLGAGPAAPSDAVNDERTSELAAAEAESARNEVNTNGCALADTIGLLDEAVELRVLRTGSGSAAALLSKLRERRRPE
jgi:hypothetical protein